MTVTQTLAKAGMFLKVYPQYLNNSCRAAVKMQNGIFLFGTKIFDKEIQRDAITCLPLELSWRIFSYLDDTSLRTVSRTHKTWARIIMANKSLRNRMNKFELAIKLGSASLAKFHRRNMRKLKKENRKKYLPRGYTAGPSTETSVTVLNTKRKGEELTVYTKRFKIY